MQLPSVDRHAGLRPAGVDLVSSNGHKVIPVAPINPPITTVFQPGMRLVLIGDSADEGRFADIHRPARPR